MAVLTRDDMVNIETGIVLAEMLGPGKRDRVRTDVPLVLRVYDRALGFAVAQRFGFENVRSTVELAAPWFIGAAIGLQVLGTFSVGQSSFVVGGMQVAAGSELDGLRMFELSTQTRVIAITRPMGWSSCTPPRRPVARRRHRLFGRALRELIDTLRKGRPPRQPGTDESASPKRRPAELSRLVERELDSGVRQTLGAGAFDGDLADRFAHEFLNGSMFSRIR